MKERVMEVYEAIRPDAVRITGAAVGAALAWLSGLPPIAQALLLTQASDVLTGVICAAFGKSKKTPSGRISSGALVMGMIKKGLEWLVVLLCVYVGRALEMSGIGGAAMTYMIATELVSLMENLSLFGLDIPILKTLLDAAQRTEGE